jgi:hypothetical protein
MKTSKFIHYIYLIFLNFIRNGAPIEMTALLKVALNFVLDLEGKGKFKHASVQTKNGNELTF